MTRKSRIIIYIAIAVTVLALGIIAVLSIPKESAPQTADEFMELGNKYLIELSYDKAVIEFNKAIEIEPRNADAYIGLAEAYLGMGDEGKAVETLELGYENTGDERIKVKLEELIGEDEETIAVTTIDEATTTTVETTTTPEPEYVYLYVPDKVECEYEYAGSCYSTGLKYYDYSIGVDFNDDGETMHNHYSFKINHEDGRKEFIGLFDYMLKREEHLEWFHVYDIPPSKVKYENRKNVECYNGDGVYYLDMEYIYDENDTLIEEIGYKAGTNEIDHYIKYDSYGNRIEYSDDDSKKIMSYVYNSDGSIAEYTQNYTDEYDGRTSYSTTVYKHTYDSNGNLIKTIHTHTSKGDFNYENKDITEYFYNDDKNIVKEVATYNIGSKWGERYGETVYEYDSIGNCISMTRTEDNKIMHKEKYSYVKVEVPVSVIKQLEEDYGIKINVFPIEE